ncbi:hypothetical protein NUW54_g12 [Trametes sanguinea]|uniref:Uncharacterized protein n=1 Tax=Trametes sanguinea TaxID=158606 RepID=A0ACC1QAE8_9APHY|nr:hypothetical protein NUW54_g12 [Trametes sanguinea]
MSEDVAPTFEVDNIIYRPLLTSIKAAFSPAPLLPLCLPPPSASASSSNTAQQRDLDPIPSSSSESFGIHHLSPHPLQQLFLEVRNLDALCELNDAIQLKATLPDVVTQAYEQAYGTPPTAAVLRFCKKELFQQIWLLLLNDDFVEAYIHGFVIKCVDRITQRLFPRILTYSADYPENCLIACIKYLGRCPCPDCLVSRDKIHLMGTKNDMANCWIFRRGVAPEGKRVEGLLGETSTSAMQSAFSRRLVSFGFNIYRTLVPDVMHEVELSVWKSTLTHLVRILVAQGASTVNIFNARFANVPPFGRDTIHRFDANIAGLKKLAAAPHWVTGTSNWRQARKSSKSKGPGQAQDIAPSAHSKGHVDRPCKDFNLNTYKFHHLGDYATSAHLVESLDGPSTVTSKLEHRHVKHFYVRTNKNFQFGLQIARHEHRKRIEPEDRSSSSPNVHTEILEELCHPLRINGFVHDNKGDLAVKDFIPKLHHHVYAWLVAGAGSPPNRNLELTGHELASLRI